MVGYHSYIARTVVEQGNCISSNKQYAFLELHQIMSKITVPVLIYKRRPCFLNAETLFEFLSELFFFFFFFDK